MLDVGGDCTVLTPDGFKRARDLSAGDPVISFVGGLPRFVRTKIVSETEPTEAVWIYGDSGDTIIGRNTSLITTSGPMSAQGFLDRRDRDHIGRMSGTWPMTETPFATFQGIRSNRSLNDTILQTTRDQISELSRRASNQPFVHRIGSHSKQQIETFSKTILGEKPSIVRGDCGWAWLSEKTKDRGKELSRSGSSAIDAETALCLWKPTGLNDTYCLPIEDRDIRLTTYALLNGIGCPFVATYKPRYFPVEVVLTLSAANPHSAVQGVITLGLHVLVHITLAGPGYPAIGPFLCEQ